MPAAGARKDGDSTSRSDRGLENEIRRSSRSSAGSERVERSSLPFASVDFDACRNISGRSGRMNEKR